MEGQTWQTSDLRSILGEKDQPQKRGLHLSPATNEWILERRDNAPNNHSQPASCEWVFSVQSFHLLHPLQPSPAVQSEFQLDQAQFQLDITWHQGHQQGTKARTTQTLSNTKTGTTPSIAKSKLICGVRKAQPAARDRFEASALWII